MREDDHAHLALDGIFADCYRRWGGRFSLIIPCEQGAIPDAYWPWLTAYDPDIVYSYASMTEADVLQLHERVGPSIYEEHRDRDRLDVHGFTPRYGAEPLQSLSTIFRRSRHRDSRSMAGPPLLIDAWHTEIVSRFLSDNFGTYHSSYATSVYPSDAQGAARLLTIVSPDKQADRRFGVPQDLHSISNELEAFKEFAHRRASSLSVASMEFATKLNVHHGRWSDAFNLVVGGSYLDRILFWNSRLLLPNWIGADLGSFRIDADQLADDQFFATLVTLINQRNFVNSGSGGQHQLTIRSTSVAEEELSAIAKRIRDGRCWSMSHAYFVQDLSVMAPPAKTLEQASPSSPLGSILNSMPRSNEFNWTEPIATPLVSPPDHLADVPHRQAFATGVWASDYVLDNGEPKPRFSNGNIWLLPRRWRMAGAFKVKFSSISRGLIYPARSSRVGELTIFESRDRQVRTIEVPTGHNAIRYSLLEDGRWPRMAGYEGPIVPRSPIDWMEPSNEARYLTGVVGMAGSIDLAFHFLLHPFMQGVFADLGGAPGLPVDKVKPTIARLKRAGRNQPYDLNNESERAALGTLIVKAAQNLKAPRRYLRYAALAELWRLHRATFWERTGRPDRADESVDWEVQEQASLDECLIAMRQRQMMFQGHEWICPECHHRNWVDMAELRPVLSCTICRHDSDAPIAFDWLFRASNFLVEALRDHSTLSLLWVLKVIRDGGRNAFIYAGPTQLWYDDRDRGPDAEVDLLMVVDNSTILAEVKSSWAGVRISDIAALGDVAKRLRPDVALLAVMDTGRQHVARLDALGAELKALNIGLRVMTLDTHPVEDDPYLW